MLGLNNVGKSFILGWISNVIILTGHSIDTKGIVLNTLKDKMKWKKGMLTWFC